MDTEDIYEIYKMLSDAYDNSDWSLVEETKNFIEETGIIDEYLENFN